MAAPKVIGLFSDHPGAGKTTVARMIQKHPKVPNGIIRSFATPLKACLMTLLEELGQNEDEIRNRLFGELKEVSICALGFKSPRELMQTLGTEWGRNLVDRDIWVNIMLSKIRRNPPGATVIIDDLRFMNEYTALKKRGATCIHVGRLGTQATTIHSSEGGLRFVTPDFTTYAQTLDELEQQVDAIVRTMFPDTQ